MKAKEITIKKTESGNRYTPESVLEAEIKEVVDMNCPICGYYCLGEGGKGCIDKKSIYELLINKQYE